MQVTQKKLDEYSLIMLVSVDLAIGQSMEHMRIHEPVLHGLIKQIADHDKWHKLSVQFVASVVYELMRQTDGGDKL